MAQPAYVDPEIIEARETGGPVRITVRPEPPAEPETKVADSSGGIYGIPFDPKTEGAKEAQAARDTAAARTAGGAKGRVKDTYGIPFDPKMEPLPPETPAREVGAPEAASIGLEQGLSFGSAPALHGLSAAAQPTLDKFAEQQGVEPSKLSVAPHVRAMMGAGDLLTQWMTGHEDPAVKEAYEAGRAHAQENKDLAKDQQAVAYLGGLLAGTVAVPGVGMMRPAATGGRMAQGGFQGGVLGGLQGAGEAIGEGKPIEEALAAGGKGVAIGAPTGAALAGVIGPRLPVAGGSRGQRAAATAENLGEAIPKGLASDNPVTQASAAAVRSMPWFGARMGHQLDRTQAAAGGAIEDIAATMAPGVTQRAAANALVTPGLEAAVQAGRTEQNALYNSLRGQIDHDTQRFALPQTQRAIDDVVAARRTAHWANPEEGLEQVQRAAAGSTFDGAHRVRTDIRNAGGGGRAPNPGYDAADFNRIERAMTQDLRQLVQAASTTPTPAGRRAALDAFTEAERRFGPIAERNRFLHALSDANGEAAIARLLGAARERGGDVQLLAYLRNTMPPDDFNMIGGMLLSEIGHSTRTGEFSIAQFATNWDKVSDGAKRVLFGNPHHRAQLEDIFSLGQHVKHAMRDTNTSHTSNTIILFDLARDAALLGVGVTTGAVSGAGVATGAVASAPFMIFAHWLSSPAHVNAMGAWSRAYRAIATAAGQPTPARIAAFKLATRNLSNTLQIPMDRLTDTILSRAGRADDAE